MAKCRGRHQASSRMTSVVDRNSVNRVQVVWWGRGLEAKAGAGECVFLAVTSLLVLLLLSFLGRTGLLADLLPSFAVEIMPGIQSFHPSITQSSVILSVYPFAASLCGVRFTLMCFLPGDKKRKACRLLGKCVGMRSERADAGTWGRNGHAGSQHTEMADVMPGSVREQKCQLCSGQVLYQALCSPPATTKVTPLQPARPQQPRVPIWLCTSAALVQ